MMAENEVLSDTDLTEAVEQTEDITIIPFDNRLLESNGYILKLHNQYLIPLENSSAKGSVNIIDPFAEKFLEGVLDKKLISMTDNYIDLLPGKMILGFTDQFIGYQRKVVPRFEPISRLTISGIYVEGVVKESLTRWPLILKNLGSQTVRLSTKQPIVKLVFHELTSPPFYPKSKLNIIPSLEWLMNEWSHLEIFYDFDDIKTSPAYNQVISSSETKSTTSKYKTNSFHHSNEDKDIIHSSSDKKQEDKKIEGPVPVNNSTNNLTRKQKQNLRKRQKRKEKKQEDKKQEEKKTYNSNTERNNNRNNRKKFLSTESMNDDSYPIMPPRGRNIYLESDQSSSLSSYRP